MAAAAPPWSRGCGNCFQCLVTRIPGPTVWKPLLLCGLKQRNRAHTTPIRKGKRQEPDIIFSLSDSAGRCRLPRGSWTVRSMGRGSGLWLDHSGREVGEGDRQSQ